MRYLIDFIVLALLYLFVLFRKWKAKGKDILLVNTLMYVYLSFVLFFTLMPVITSLPFILNHPYNPPNMVPFVDVLAGRGDFVRQVLLNIIMTVPFGFLFPMTRKPAAGFGKTVFFCFIMSLGIELLQPLLDGFRSADITDLITNTVGGAAGWSWSIVFAILHDLLFDFWIKKDRWLFHRRAGVSAVNLSVFSFNGQMKNGNLAFHRLKFILK